jgi:hypothetical protein
MPDYPQVAQDTKPVPPKKRSERDDDILEESRDRFHLTADAEHDLREQGLKDDEFRSGDHWPQDIKQRRDADGRPCLTIDKLSQPIRQITNRERQSRPAIQINPVSGGADQETAEIAQGLIRQIESASYADVAYDWAFDGAASRGWGYFRVLTEYEAPESFDQVLKIEWIENPYTVYLDPTARQWNASDAMWGHVVQDLTPEEFDRRFKSKGESAKGSLQLYSSLGDQAPDWFPNGQIRIAEYFYVDFEDFTLVQLNNGQVVDQSTLPKRLPRGIAVVQERQSQKRTVKWCLHSATAILEKRVWPGKFIPIVRVEGERLNVDGKRILRGLVRTARDSQRMYDYWVSTATETTALAPRAPFVMYEGQDEGYEAMWQQANVKTFSALKVRATTKATGGQLLPLPTRNAIEPPIQAMMAGVSQAEQDIRSITGFYDATDPRRANSEQSGRAILSRQQQGQETNSNFLDNLGRSIRYVGEILMDLLPKIYDRPGRVIQVLSIDDEVKEVMLGQPFRRGPEGQAQASPAEQPLVKGLDQFFDLSKGRYSVTVTVGAPYTTRRQEAVSSMLELVRAEPNLAPLISDILVENMDWPGAPKLAERLKKALPPQLQEGNDANAQVAQLQQQLQQMGMQQQAMTDQLNKQTDILKSNAQENASKERISQEQNASRERIAAIQAQTQLVVAAEKLQADQNMEGLKQQLIAVTSMLEGARAGMDQATDLAFEHESAQNAQAHELATGAADAALQQRLQESQEAAAAQQQPEV